MSDRLIHKIIANHVWRALRAVLLLAAIVVWLWQDGWQSSDSIILCLCLAAHTVEQLHGFICNKIEQVLGWKQDFKNWE